MERFVITKKTDGRFQFDFRDMQDRTILYSGSYTRKTMCIKGIYSVKRNSKDKTKFKKKTISSDNKFYFNLKSFNGKIIAISELFEEKELRDLYIASIKNNAENAIIEERVN